MKNYYQILNIKPTATEDDIKRCYRVLAKRYHPDVNPGDARAADRFADINEAYDVLFDPVKRAEYDRQVAAEAAAKPRPEDIVARRRAAQSAQSQYAAQQAAAQAAARQRAAQQAAAMRAAAMRGGADASFIYASQAAAQANAQAAAAKAQAQEQARQYKIQLAAAEKRAHDLGVAEGKRLLQPELNAANTELRSVKAENTKLQSKVDGMTHDRADLEQELFNRDREYNQEKRRAADLEKQIQILKTSTVPRTELTALNNELRSARAEANKLARQLATAERARTEAEKKLAERARQESERRLAEHGAATGGQDAERVAELESQLKDLKRKTVAKTAFDAIKTANKKLLAENTELKARIEELEAQAKNVAAESGTSYADAELIETLKARIAELEMQAENAPVSSDVTGDSESEAMQNRIAESEAQIEKLQSDRAVLIQKLQEMNEALKAALERAETAEKNAAAASSAERRNDVGEFDADAQAQIDELQNDKNMLIQKLQQMNAELESAYGRAETAERRVIELDEEKERLIEKFKEVHGETIGEANAKVKEVERELEERVQKLNAELEAERERTQELQESLVDEEDMRVKVDRLTFNAEAGDADSQNELGEMYLYGDGVEKDYDRAAYWIKEAAKQKHADAMYNLGVCFLNGAGVEKNAKAGAGFIRQAAKLGSQKAKKYKKGKDGIL